MFMCVNCYTSTSIPLRSLTRHRYELQRRVHTCIPIDPHLSNPSVLSRSIRELWAARARRSAGRHKPSLWCASFCRCCRVSLNIFRQHGFLRSSGKSAGDVLLACFDEEVLGEYPMVVFLCGSRKAETSRESRDVEKHNALGADSLKLVGIEDGDTVLKDWR